MAPNVVKLRSPATAHAATKRASWRNSKNLELSVGSSTEEHKEVEVVSCYRSSGSIPVPRPRSQAFTSYIPPPVKRRPSQIELPKIREAEEDWIRFKPEEQTNFDVNGQKPKEAKCRVRVEPDHGIQDPVSPLDPVQVLECKPKDPTPEPEVEPEPELAPLPPKRKEVNTCKKHSKCHCHLFSMETDGFFAV